jgi:hypothetical protein
VSALGVVALLALVIGGAYVYSELYLPHEAGKAATRSFAYDSRDEEWSCHRSSWVTTSDSTGRSLNLPDGFVPEDSELWTCVEENEQRELCLAYVDGEMYEPDWIELGVSATCEYWAETEGWD